MLDRVVVDDRVSFIVSLNHEVPVAVAFWSGRVGIVNELTRYVAGFAFVSAQVTRRRRH